MTHRQTRILDFSQSPGRIIFQKPAEKPDENRLKINGFNRRILTLYRDKASAVNPLFRRASLFYGCEYLPDAPR